MMIVKFARQRMWFRGVGLACATCLAMGCTGDSSTGTGNPAVIDLEHADPELGEVLRSRLVAVYADPASGDARGRLGMAYHVNGFDEAALTTYEQAESLQPVNAAWPYYQALLLGKRGDLSTALQRLDRAMAIDPGYAPAYLRRGRWLLDMGKFEEAAIAYQRADALGAGPPARVGLAETLLLQGRSGDAVAVLEPINVVLQHPFVFRLLGQAYRDLGRDDEARIAMARGRSARPVHWPDPRHDALLEFVGGFGRRLAHAEDLLESGRHEDATALLESLRHRYGDRVSIVTKLGWVYLRTGRHRDAAQVLQSGLETHPESYFLHLDLGRLRNTQGDYDKALFHLQRAVAANSSHPAAHKEQGMVLARLGRHDDAVAAFEVALRHGVRDAEQVLHVMGLANASRRRWAEAVDYFEQATDLDPAFTMAFVHLGRCLAATERWDQASRALAWADWLGTHPHEVAAARRVLVDMRKVADGRVSPAASEPDR